MESNVIDKPLSKEEIASLLACIYCKKINSLVFAGDEWIHASIVCENEINKLEKPVGLNIILRVHWTLEEEIDYE